MPQHPVPVGAAVRLFVLSPLTITLDFCAAAWHRIRAMPFTSSGILSDFSEFSDRHRGITRWAGTSPIQLPDLQNLQDGDEEENPWMRV